MSGFESKHDGKRRLTHPPMSGISVDDNDGAAGELGNDIYSKPYPHHSVQMPLFKTQGFHLATYKTPGI